LTTDDVIHRSRLRLFALAREMGIVRAACRLLGSTTRPTTGGDASWCALDPSCCGRGSAASLGCRMRFRPWSSNASRALALAQPGWGPDRLSLELGREKWGGLKVSAKGVWRVLKRHGLNTRAKRLSLVCGYDAPPQPERPEAPPERHIEAKHPRLPSSVRQLLHRSPGRHRGRGLAVHGLRRGLPLHLGRAPRHSQEPLCKLMKDKFDNLICLPGLRGSSPLMLRLPF
jgi:hypothetical protein